EEVPRLMHHDTEQVDAVPLALVPGLAELGVVSGRPVHEPAPASGVDIRPDGMVAPPAQRRPGEVGDADLDVAQPRGVRAGRPPSDEGLDLQHERSWPPACGDGCMPAVARGEKPEAEARARVWTLRVLAPRAQLLARLLHFGPGYVAGANPLRTISRRA